MANTWQQRAKEYLGFAVVDPADPYATEEFEMDHMAPVTPIGRKKGEVLEEAPVYSELPRIVTVHPRTYTDAKVIGDAYRAGTPVIMNLSDMTDADAKRMVDFASGLVFGRYGGLEKVTSRVFLLYPENLEVATEEQPQTESPVLFSQSR